MSTASTARLAHVAAAISYMFLCMCSWWVLDSLFIASPLPDLLVYRRAGQDFLAGYNPYISVYTVPFGPDTFVLNYFYPPAFGVSVGYLDKLCGDALPRVWLTSNVLLCAGSAWLLSHVTKEEISPLRRLLRASLGLVLFIALPPSLDGIYLGQVHLMVAACISVFLWAVAREKLALAGAALAISVLIKITPILLIIPLCRKLTRPLVVGFLGTLSVGVIAGALSVGGIANWGDFFASTLQLFLQGAAVRNPDNLALGNAACLAMGACGPMGTALPFLAVMLVFVTLSLMDAAQLTRYHGMLVALTLLPVLSPVVWYHHLIWLLPVVIVASSAMRQLSSRLILWIAFVVTMCSLPVQVVARQQGQEFLGLGAILVVLPSLGMFYLLRREFRANVCER